MQNINNQEMARFAAGFARLGGSSKSAEKAAAARSNGKLGGRPKSLSDGERWVDLRQVKEGEYLRLVPGGPVWVRGVYSISGRCFFLSRHDDMNHEVPAFGGRSVVVGFTF